MNFINKYTERIVKYDFINKFNYAPNRKLPILKFVVLNFNFKKSDFKQLITALSSLELISAQKGHLTTSKVANISFKLRKGQPIGCKVILRKKKMNKFLIKLLNKSFAGKQIKKCPYNNLFSINIKSVLIFKELEQNYKFFNNLSSLTINIKIDQCNFNEFYFLLTSYKFLT